MMLRPGKLVKAGLEQHLITGGNLGQPLLDGRVQVDPFVVESLQLLQPFGNLLAERDGSILDAARNQVGHQTINNAAVGPAEELLAAQGDILPADELQFDGILYIPADIGNGVGKPDHAAFRGHGNQFPARVAGLGCPLGVEIGKGLAALGRKSAVVDLPVVAHDAVQGLQGQVPPPALPLDALQKPDALQVVLERGQPMPAAQGVQNLFPVMAKGRMPDIMAQGDGLDEILVQPQIAADGPGDL